MKDLTILLEAGVPQDEDSLEKVGAVKRVEVYLWG